MLGAAPRLRVLQAITVAELTALIGHAGAGKTVALGDALAAHHGASIHLNARTLDAASLPARFEHARESERCTDTPVLLVIDDLEQADAAASVALAELIDRWSRPHRLLLAGRRLPGPITSAIERREGRFIDARELRFEDHELHEVLGTAVTRRLDAAEPRLLADRCAGWPAAIARMARRLQSASGSDQAAWDALVAELVTEPVALREQITTLLEAAPRDHAPDAVTQLAGLPGFDDALCQRCGLPGGVDELRDLGLPLEAMGARLTTIPDRVRALLAPATLEPALARHAAAHYVELGLTGAALEVLATPATAEDLASTLSELPAARLGQLDPARHAAAVGALPTHTLATHPRILLQLADGLVLAGQAEEYRETISRARWLTDEYPDAAPAADRLEVHAADLTMRAVATGDDAVIEAAEALLAVPALPLAGRARVLGGLGRTTATAGTATALRRGARQLERSAQLFTQVRAEIHAAASLTVAATHANWPLGRYRLALEQLDLALRHTRDNPRARIAVLPYRAFVLIDLGRYPEAESDLAELRRTAHRTDPIGNERAAAFARWGAARIASQQGDAATTWAACQAVAESIAVVDAGSGATFRADAAQLLARVGRQRDAQAFLDEARQRDPGRSTAVEVAAFVLATRAGDQTSAMASLDALQQRDNVEPRDRWRITLLHAYLRHLNAGEDAQALAAAAFEQAAQLGYPDLPMIREPEIARELLRLGSSHSASARELALPGHTRIRVLGGLSVEQDGTTLQPRGRAGELIALLALNNRSITVDRAIDALWPEADARRGRERLRTVLHRVRRDHGALIERRGDTIDLHDRVRVDVEEFLELTRRARSPDPQAHRAAAAAITAYTGEVLPGFDDHSWAVIARRQLERRLLEMHDLVAGAAEVEGHLDEAIRVSEAATVIDDTAEHHHLAIARLLAEQGHYRQALRRLTDARTALLAQGLEPSDELARLEAYLERTSGSASRSG